MIRTFDLPYPPSVNSIYKYRRGRIHLDPKVETFRLVTVSTLSRLRFETLEGRACFAAILREPKLRRLRDIDNAPKALLDACTFAKLWIDDSQVDGLYIARGIPDVDEGRVECWAAPAEQWGEVYQCVRKRLKN